ncbi:MAG: AAA family ATPase [Jaaginema sp. PMC 1080.18]|nr:AAA family ATPase [Jaaginema sp. PMC 1080.18]MEC4868287.1 AAA family ATPase [Jaaginema sp. PMC 1078.18]
MSQWTDFQVSLPQRTLTTELDREQSSAKNFNPKGVALVRGVAGSGKSLVLRQRLETLSEQFDTILVLCYNRFMKEWIQTTLEKKQLQTKVDCLTFHRWAGNTLNYKYDWDKEAHTRRQVVSLAKKSGLQYEAILIDEAQDFYDEWFQALLQVLDPQTNSLFFVYDNTQAVYGQPHRRQSNWTWKQLGIDIPGGRSQVFDLNYRNSPEIIELAWQFMLPTLQKYQIKVEPRLRDEAGKVVKTPGIGSIIEPRKKASRSSNLTPLLLPLAYNDMALQIAQEVKLALESHKESSIGILVHPSQGDLRQAISQELKYLGIAHNAPKSSTERGGNVVNRPYIVVDSWNALKGVEFDAVIIPGCDLIPEFLEDGDREFQEYAGLYTAMTRARDHLVLLYQEENAVVNRLEQALTAEPVLQSEA